MIAYVRIALGLDWKIRQKNHLKPWRAHTTKINNNNNIESGARAPAKWLLLSLWVPFKKQRGRCRTISWSRFCACARCQPAHRLHPSIIWRPYQTNLYNMVWYYSALMHIINNHFFFGPIGRATTKTDRNDPILARRHFKAINHQQHNIIKKKKKKTTIKWRKKTRKNTSTKHNHSMHSATHKIDNKCSSCHCECVAWS